LHKRIKKKNHKSKEQGLNRKTTYEKLKLKDEIEKKKSKFYKRVKDKNYKPKEYGLNPKTKQNEEQL
jgi:hypothetical protein